MIPGKFYKTIYVVFSNTDLTEGRGAEHPIGCFESKTSAINFSKKKGVQGTDADVREMPSFLVDMAIYGHCVYAPAIIHKPSDEDKRKDELHYLRENALKKAKAAGLTKEEIDLIAKT